MMKTTTTRRTAGSALCLAGILAFAAVTLWAGRSSAMLNPDAVYCRALGYQYIIARSKRGVFGICKLPDGKLVNANDFSHGRVALESSYCAQQGLEGKHQTNGPICRDCLVCVKPGGEEVAAVKLMGLSYRESKCGDGKCGTMEDTSNCPADCPAGGLDEYCDGLADDKCDPDCQNLGQDDADCDAAANGNGGGCGCETGPGGSTAAGTIWLALLGLGLIALRRRQGSTR
jgi:MYXO-CTERM domain-containing protein